MKGKNKFHELCSIDDTDWRHYHFTAFDSPNWTAEELEKIKKRIPDNIWRQEYLSEALDNAGTVFRNIANCIKEPVTAKIDIMSIDLAKHQDFTVIMLGSTANKQVLKIDRFNNIDWGFQKKRIYSLWQENGKPKVVIDSTGVGDAIYDDLVRAGMNVQGFKFTSQSKSEIIENLSVAIDNQEIFYPNDKDLLNELSAFGFEITPTRNIRYNAPAGVHDDMVISLALFNYLIKSNIVVNLNWI
jgi:hypothetical protein